MDRQAADGGRGLGSVGDVGGGLVVGAAGEHDDVPGHLLVGLALEARLTAAAAAVVAPAAEEGAWEGGKGG